MLCSNRLRECLPALPAVGVRRGADLGDGEPVRQDHGDAAELAADDGREEGGQASVRDADVRVTESADSACSCYSVSRYCNMSFNFLAVQFWLYKVRCSSGFKCIPCSF